MCNATVKFGGGIREWGYFSWNGLGLLVILHGNINAEGYKAILTRYILSMAEDQFGDKRLSASARQCSLP
jgi:hypothetical protein